MAERDYRKIYRAIPLFRGLTEPELSDIISVSKLFRVRGGVAVMKEGDPSNGMYVIVDGSVEIRMKLQGKDDTQLAVLQKGALFGELALVDDSPRSASALTMTDSVLYRLESEGFRQMRQQLKPAAYKIIRKIAPVICERLRTINDRISTFLSDPDGSVQELEDLYLDSSELPSKPESGPQVLP